MPYTKDHKLKKKVNLKESLKSLKQDEYNFIKEMSLKGIKHVNKESKHVKEFDQKGILSVRVILSSVSSKHNMIQT